MVETTSCKWPKVAPPLTESQKAISDDFMKAWHEALPRYSLLEKFNHGWVVKNAPKNFTSTLEIGAGLGEHLAYERLTATQEQSYVAVDIRDNMVAELRQRYPRVQALVGDCQQRLDFPNGHFDRLIAVHVMEHLPDLPAAIREMYRLCNKTRGTLQVIIPCEGGLVYTACRKVSSQRMFEKRYKQPYRWFIEREHLNIPAEILGEIEPYFTMRRRYFFPFAVPFVWCNVCIGFNFTPKANPQSRPALQLK